MRVYISLSSLQELCDANFFPRKRENVQIGLGFVNFFFLLFAAATYYKGAKETTTD